MPSLIPARETAKTKRFSPFIMIYYSKFLSLVVTHGPSVVTCGHSCMVIRGKSWSTFRTDPPFIAHLLTYCMANTLASKIILLKMIQNNLISLNSQENVISVPFSS